MLLTAAQQLSLHVVCTARLNNLLYLCPCCRNFYHIMRFYIDPARTVYKPAPASSAPSANQTEGSSREGSQASAPAPPPEIDRVATDRNSISVPIADKDNNPALYTQILTKVTGASSSGFR